MASFTPLEKNFVKLNETWETFVQKIKATTYKFGDFDSWNDPSYGTYFASEADSFDYYCNHKKRNKLDMITCDDGGIATCKNKNGVGNAWVVRETESGELWINFRTSDNLPMIEKAGINFSEETAEKIEGSEKRKYYHAYYTEHTHDMKKSDGKTVEVKDRKWWKSL